MEFEGIYEDFGVVEWPGPEPLRFENCVPVYTKDQIDECLPDEWGISIYLVVESPIYESGYEKKPEFRRVKEKHHLYSRVDRFKTTLYQLLGARGRVPWQVLVVVAKGFDKHPDKVWDSVRDVLYRNGLAMYYNRIPSILDLLGYEKKIKWVGDVDEIIRDFMRMSNKFDHVGEGYFPNLRFTALRLLEEYGCVFEYRIPFLRTRRKLGPANEIWDFLYYDAAS